MTWNCSYKENYYFGLKLIVERKLIKIVYKENYCDEAL